MSTENDLAGDEKLKFTFNPTEDVVKEILYHNALQSINESGRPYDLSKRLVSTQLTTTKDEHFMIYIPQENINELYERLKGVFIPESDNARALLYKIFTLMPLAESERLLWIDQTQTGPANLTIYYLITNLVDSPMNSRLTIYDFIRMNFDSVNKVTLAGRQPFNMTALRSSRKNYENALAQGKRKPSAKVELIKRICYELRQ